MGREVFLFIIITTGKHAGSVLGYHHLPVDSALGAIGFGNFLALLAGNI